MWAAAASSDPYLGDRNVREAASFHVVGMTLLLAALGFAAGGWFESRPASGQAGAR